MLELHTLFLRSRYVASGVRSRLKPAGFRHRDMPAEAGTQNDFLRGNWMKTIKQAAREARQLFRLCLIDNSLDAARVQKVVQGILQSHRRGGYLLLSRFLRLVKIERSRHTAEVES